MPHQSATSRCFTVDKPLPTVVPEGHGESRSAQKQLNDLGMAAAGSDGRLLRSGFDHGIPRLLVKGIPGRGQKFPPWTELSQRLSAYWLTSPVAGK